jgi:hypothetical protein
MFLTYLNRPSFKILIVPLVLLVLSQVLGELVRIKTIEEWSFVVCVFFSPLLLLHVWGAGKAWDDFKRRGYPPVLALLALALNVLSPFLVVYVILYT